MQKVAWASNNVAEGGTVRSTLRKSERYKPNSGCTTFVLIVQDLSEAVALTQVRASGGKRAFLPTEAPAFAGATSAGLNRRSCVGRSLSLVRLAPPEIEREMGPCLRRGDGRGA
jgi:hypothetical protein